MALLSSHMLSNCIIEENKSLASMSEGLSRDALRKIPRELWQQELHYFIVEKLLSLGICRMEVIFKAIDKGTLHTPKSYSKPNNRKQFVKDHILTILEEHQIDKKFISFVFPARIASMGTAGDTLNYKRVSLFWYLLNLVIRCVI